MEKRLVLAIVVSFAFVMAWSHFMVKPPATVNQPAPAPAVSSQEPVSAPALSSIISEEAKANFDVDRTGLVFSEPGAFLTEAIFTQFQDHKFILEKGFSLVDTGAKFLRQPSENKEITYIGSTADKKFIKRLSKGCQSYVWDLEISIQNISDKPINYQLPLALGTLGLSEMRKPEAQFQHVCISQKLKVDYPDIKKESSFNEIEFASLRDQYFVLIVQPQSPDYSARIVKYNKNQCLLLVQSKELNIAPGQEIVQRFQVYLGPQDTKILGAISQDWNSVVFYGRFDFIAKLLAKTLDLFYSLTRSWGWSVILFSLTIYWFLFPLSLKQMASMRKMQEMQPQLQELESKYKDNPQKLNLERMELFKKNKVNPMGGCLPMILQLPIFLKLYLVLMRSIYLKGADFLWIKDLSRPDRLVKMFHAEHLGEWQYLNILPVLIGMVMFIQQKTSVVQMSGPHAEQQKMMMVVMPVMMVFVFYSMPSAIVLYWLVNNVLMVGYQLLVVRKK